MSDRVIRVLCVDDNPDLALLLHKRLATHDGLQSVGQVHDLVKLLDAVRRLAPDIVVLDYKMPGGDPLQVLRELHATFPATRALVYSGYQHHGPIEEARQAGAWGYVVKRDDVDELVAVIRQVAAGQRVFPSA
jgi:two-component system response regulator DesR